jgi:hypothetical protein
MEMAGAGGPFAKPFRRSPSSQTDARKIAEICGKPE